MVMASAEEQALLRQAQRGDAEAFAELYRANVQAIFRFAYVRVNDRALAEDLTAEVCAKALQGIAGYEDRGRPFVAWLYSIARARVIDHYRRQDRRPVQSDIEAEDVHSDEDMDLPMLRQQAAKALRLAIGDLTEDQQQVIILRFIEGYSIDTVAKLIGKRPNAVKALQHRALRSLASRLQRSGFDMDNILPGLS
jgi:RNA polymerase sigma-70 factor (ECF subfamily)